MPDQSKKMKAWQLHAPGIKNMTLDHIAIPVPAPDELLIKVGAVSLNFRDKAIIDGLYDPSLVPVPLIPVSDVAGQVIRVGSQVTRFRAGDRVTTHHYSKWIDGEPGPRESVHCFGAPLQGGLSEYMIMHEAAAVAVPGYLTDEEASTLPIAAVTAWYSLVEYGKIKSGNTVLIQGTGGVSIFGIQFAKVLGASTIVLTSSEEKAKKVKALGAGEVINYHTCPDWENKVREITNDRGVDMVLDVVGGDGINKSVIASRVGGKIAVIGFLNGFMSNLNLLQMLFRQPVLRGIAVGHRTAFEEMNKAMDQHRIKPVIETVYPFEEAVRAFEHLERGAFGKIVISLGHL